MTPARKSKHSRDKTASRTKYATREVRSRDPRPIVVVICDDSRTAVNYFAPLKQRYKTSLTLRVEPAPCHGATPEDIISCAQEAVKRFRGSKDDHLSVWALIDTEHDHKTCAAAMSAKAAAAGHSYEVALSKPCFEIWTLLHLVSSGAHHKDCQAVLAALRKSWKAKFYEEFPSNKARADYAKLVPLISDAVRNASLHHANEAPSWTEVYLVIKDIERLASGRP